MPRNNEQIWEESRDLIAATKHGVLASCLTLILAVPAVSLAVSGGGLDYANLDITGQDFSKNSYKGKDFTQVIAKGTKFASSNLQGCRFYKAYLVKHKVGCKRSPRDIISSLTLFSLYHVCRLMPTLQTPTCVVLHSKILVWMVLLSRIQTLGAPTLVRVCWMSERLRMQVCYARGACLCRMLVLRIVL